MMMMIIMLCAHRVFVCLFFAVAAGFIFQLANMLFTVCMQHPQFLAQSQLATTASSGQRE
eukprot:COSAG03_NODE_19471_length_336_cov_0.632911_2_plen_59_part_01